MFHWSEPSGVSTHSTHGQSGVAPAAAASMQRKRTATEGTSLLMHSTATNYRASPSTTMSRHRPSTSGTGIPSTRWPHHSTVLHSCHGCQPYHLSSSVGRRASGSRARTVGTGASRGAGRIRQATWADSQVTVVLAVAASQIIRSPPAPVSGALGLEICLGVDRRDGDAATSGQAGHHEQHGCCCSQASIPGSGSFRGGHGTRG
jgi:hypothetical protein